MATKTFEELKQLAIQIRDEKTNKANTATRIGTQMIEHLNKLEQEYYNKDGVAEQLKTRDDELARLDKMTTEYNVSVLHPTSGSGGSNKYTLETAIAQVPTKYRSIGLKCSFVNESGKPECWKYQGGSWVAASFVKEADGGNKILEWVTDTATTRKQVAQSERKSLLQISYKNADGDIVNEQYIGTSYTDAEWGKDTNWEQIPNQNQMTELEGNIVVSLINSRGNLLTSADYQDGKSLNTSGAEYSADGYRLWNYISVIQGIKIRAFIESNFVCIGVYDKNKKYLGQLDKAKFNGNSFAIDIKDAAYIRFTCKISDADIFYIFLYNSEDMAKYESDIAANGNNYFDITKGFEAGYRKDQNRFDVAQIGSRFVEVSLGDVLYFAYTDIVSSNYAYPLSFFDADKNFIESANADLYSLNRIVISNPYVKYVQAVTGLFSSKPQQYKTVIGIEKFLYKESEIKGLAIYDKIQSMLGKVNSPIINSWGQDRFVLSKANNILPDNILSDFIFNYAGNPNFYLMLKEGEQKLDNLHKSIDTLKLQGLDTKYVIKCTVELLSENPLYINGYSSNNLVYLTKNNPVVKDFYLTYYYYGNAQFSLTKDAIASLDGASVKISNIEVMLVNLLWWNKIVNSDKSFLYYATKELTNSDTLFARSIPALIRGKELVQFGDSTQECNKSIRSCDIIATRLGIKCINAALSGSRPISLGGDETNNMWNLRDENLQNITENTGIVVIAGGINTAGNLSESNKGEIDSRDRTTMYGCINYAIDYALSKNPCCIVVLQTVIRYKGSSNDITTREDWNDVYRSIAQHRPDECVLADVAKYSNMTIENLYYLTYDGLHPTNEYCVRIAACVLNALRPYVC